MKEEALNLADDIDDYWKVWQQNIPLFQNSSDMIRKLVAELDKQGEPVAWILEEDYAELLAFKKENPKAFKKVEVNMRINFNDDIPLYTAPQTKPYKPTVYQWDYVASSDGDGFIKIEMPCEKWNELIDIIDLAPQTKPLSDEEIIEIWDKKCIVLETDKDVIEFARAIEERHGIK